jgi:hypothetical protein
MTLVGRAAVFVALAFGQSGLSSDDAAQGFDILPRRRVDERMLARLGRWSRFTKSLVTDVVSSTQWILITPLRRFVRNLARLCYYGACSELDS